MHFIRPIGRVLDNIENLFAVIAISILIFITASVCLEVVMRYGFNNPLIWVVEVSESALLYITFLGGAWVLRHNGHVRIDIFINMISKQHYHHLGLTTSIIGVLVSVVFTIWGITTTWDHWLRGIYKPTVLEIPSWILLCIIPLGAFLMGTRFFRQAINHWNQDFPHDFENQEDYF
jgi:TRAP-type C4-dicarboxylate transport system permease small subunit